MRRRAEERRVVLMTETERAINKKLIARVGEFRSTGKVDLSAGRGLIG